MHIQCFSYLSVEFKTAKNIKGKSHCWFKNCHFANLGQLKRVIFSAIKA